MSQFYSSLICPVCGEGYLHQGAVVSCFREREDAPSRAVMLTGGDLMLDAIATNPSPRRDGLYIKFECEICHGADRPVDDTPPYYLTIFQHKGYTYIYWELPNNTVARFVTDENSGYVRNEV